MRKPAREQPRQSADKAVTWAAWGLITPALIAAIVAVPDPTPTDNQPIGKILSLVTVIYFMAGGSRGTDARHLASAALPPDSRPESHRAGFASCG